MGRDVLRSAFSFLVVSGALALGEGPGVLRREG